MADLQSRRRQAADGEWERYDMGPCMVEAFDGWEWVEPSDEVTRVVYFENSEDPGSDTVRGYFTVRFLDSGSDEVGEAYASLGGCLFGRRVPEETVAPPGPSF